MKAYLLKNQIEILFYFVLILLFLITDSLEVRKEPNLSRPISFSVDSNIVKNMPKIHYPKKIIINEQVSNFEYFKNCIFYIFSSVNPFNYFSESEKSAITDSSISNLKINSKKSKVLNFDNDRLKIMKIPKCNSDSCDKLNGECITETKCKCKSNYIIIPNNNLIKSCNYKLSYQLIALLLEIFLPFGFGHFYCKRYLIAIMKFTILLIIPTILFLLYKNFFNRNANNNSISKFSDSNFINKYFNVEGVIKRLVTFYFIIIFIVWYLFDLAIFTANKHKDGSGFDLIPI